VRRYLYSIVTGIRDIFILKRYREEERRRRRRKEREKERERERERERRNGTLTYVENTFFNDICRVLYSLYILCL